MYKRVLRNLFWRVLISYFPEGLTMNVYMLKTQFSPETLGDAEAARKQVENTLRKALGAENMADQFSRVSMPYEDQDMKMAVVCSEEAAQKLRAMAADLDIASLDKDEGRTTRLRAVSGLRA